MKLSFYGGVQQITGSNFLLEHNGRKILVDCGLFQGSKYAETLNYSDFAYNPKDIDFVLITHSHADHTGRLPKLYKDGFRGKIFATKPTIDLSAIALEDNLDLIKNESRKDGHDPLFNAGDLHETFILAQGVEYGEELDLGGGTKATFHEAGHILGSAIIEIQWQELSNNLVSSFENNPRTIYFSGDLGNYPVPLLKHYDMPNQADYIVIESTYGDRVHKSNANRKIILRQAMEETIQSGGMVMIPTFAIERTQELLYEINEMIEHENLARIPIFLDSPLAIKLTKVYRNYEQYFNRKVVHDIRTGDNIFDFPGLKLTFSSQDSKEINKINGSKIIIAGSGMSFGGRIIFHEIRYLPDPKSTILFVGYQVDGSPGRQILDGKKSIKLMGQNVTVNCRVKAIEGYSAHADRQMLVDWVGKAVQDGNLKKVFIVHGEYNSSKALQQEIKNKFIVDTAVPAMGDEFVLE